MTATRRPFASGPEKCRAAAGGRQNGLCRAPRSGAARRCCLLCAAMAVVAVSATPAAWRDAVAADAAPPPASAPAQSGPADQPSPPFQPQKLSIGEPISLPNATPLQPSRTPPAPSALPPSPGRLPATAAQPAAAAGTGWLGLAVDDTLLTGRLVVVEVAADSPAATAGVRQQDVLLAINGAHVQTADEMAAALAAIAPGQRVNVAVGRDSRVDDLVLTAAARPVEARSRNWQSTSAVDPAAVPRSVLATNDAPSPPAAAMTAVAMPPATNAPAASLPPTPPAAFGAAAVPPPATSVTTSAPLSAAAAPAVPAFVPPAPTASAYQPATPAPATFAPAAALAAAAPAQLPQQAATASSAGGRLALGVRTVPVDPALQSRFQMADTRGAYVIGVVENLPAARAGVPPGSVIVALNQQPVRSPQDLTQLVTHGPAGTPVTLQYVLPGGESRHASVVLQSLDEPLERALVGDASGPRPVVPTPLQTPPAPQVARRVAPAAAFRPADDGSTIIRLEAALRRMTEQLERIDRRLEQLESRR